MNNLKVKIGMEVFLHYGHGLKKVVTITGITKIKELFEIEDQLVKVV